MYGNEKEVGLAITASGLDRDDVFVTSKLNNSHHPYSDALAAFDRTLSDLGLEYVDLFLIHWPLPAVGDFVETWRALESVYRDDRARAIGVSNFHADHLRRLLDETELVPAVNQIEAHPYLTQEPLRAFNASHASKPRPGRRSPGAGCWTIRPSRMSSIGPVGQRPRSCCDGTFN